MTAITAVIFPDAEAWLKDNAPYFTLDDVALVHRAGPFVPDAPEFVAEYVDLDLHERLTKGRTMADHVAALKKLCRLVDGKRLYVGGLRGAAELTDAGNWDAEVVDAYYQLLYHGEVIYG